MTAVADYLRKSGFVNIEVAPNRLLVSARGTADTVKTAFNTSSNRYTMVPTQTVKTNGTSGSYSDDPDGGKWDLDGQPIVGSAGD